MTSLEEKETLTGAHARPVTADYLGPKDGLQED